MSSQTKKPNPVQVGGYTIDCSVSESHTFESEVTEFPVEQGSPISDNVRPKPIVVTINGIVSDTPIGKMADLRNSEHGDQAFTPTADTATAKARGDQQSAPSVDALAALISIRDNRQPITISTSLQIFENMVMTSLEIPRDATTGAALRFTATFQQVTLVTNQRTTVRIIRTATPSGAKKTTVTKLSKRTGIQGFYVYTWATALRKSATQTMGAPPVLTDSYGDHYRLYDNAKVDPDGYIGSDNKYHPLQPLDAVRGGIVDTTAPATVNGKKVAYDPGSGKWLDSKGQGVTQSPVKQINDPSLISQLYGGNTPALGK